MAPSVLVADDHGIFRVGVRALLERDPDFEVCSEAEDGEEVLAQVREHRPDVVVLDIAMPGMNGLETLKRIREQHPEVKVVLVSMHGSTSFVQSAVALGADGYVLKDGGPEELVAALRSVTSGGSYYSPAVAREVVRQLRSPGSSDPDPFTLLSRREREVLGLITDGLTAKQMGERLDISPKTVEAHRTSLMRKLGLRKATELVRYALRRGLVIP